jgi:hypothetical protein
MNQNSQNPPSKSKNNGRGWFQMPPEPKNIASTPPLQKTQRPMLPVSPAMVNAIKQSRKGKIPPGLAKWIASHKKGGK